MNSKSTREGSGSAAASQCPRKMSDSGLTGKKMSIYTKRRQGEKEGDNTMEKERERNREREKKRNKGKKRRREGRKKRRKRFHCTTQ